MRLYDIGVIAALVIYYGVLFVRYNVRLHRRLNPPQSKTTSR